MTLDLKEASAVYGCATDHIRQLDDFHNLYAVNTSLFRTPQELVIVRYEPERQFACKIIENSRLIDSWIKSPDSSFYGLDYEYWKAGKDRVRRSFNPDFFIRVNLADYLLRLSADPKDMSVQRLREYQDKGIEDLILVVEIKHDDDTTEQTRAKEEYGILHFQALNMRLRSVNAIDLPEQFRDDLHQLYSFKILHPNEFNNWFARLRTGLIAFDFEFPGQNKDKS